MKGMFRVAIELVLAIVGVSVLELSLWQGAGLIMAVMAVPAFWAIAQNHGSDLLALAVVYVTTGLVGGFAAPEGFHLALWAVGLVAGVFFLVIGLCLVFGIALHPARQPNPHGVLKWRDV